MISIGIDPGLSGAVAILAANDPEATEVFDMPVFAYAEKGFVRRAVDLPELADLLWATAEANRRGASATAYLERVNAMPGQGVASMFSLGMSYWGVRGVLAAFGIPTRLVPPVDWKRHFRIGRDKGESLALARSLFPQMALTLQKHHGRAEALLIAKYGSGL